MKTAIVNKPGSKAHGKKVYVQSVKGRIYKCSFKPTIMENTYPFWKNELNFKKDEA